MYAAQPYRNCTRPAPTACQTLAIRFLALLALCVAAFVSTTVVADSGVYKQTLKSTAWVISVDGDSVSLGTGVVIDAEKKLLVTNSHVVGENRNALVFFPAARSGKDLDQGVIVEKGYYTKKSDDIGVQGAVVAIDRKRDLALVELNVDTLPQNVQAIPMADNEVSPGDSVHSIGNPGSSDALWVYSSGTVRAVYKKRFNATSGEHQFRVIETQAPLNTGDSGGPIVNDAGELVGIAQSVSRRGTLVSHCVELSELKTFLDSPWKPAPLSANKLLTATDLKFENHSSGNFEVTVPPAAHPSWQRCTARQTNPSQPTPW
ncbi:MAG: serine protease, partial [Planctomycetota bacterium]